jgi:hypothetical protein
MTLIQEKESFISDPYKSAYRWGRCW